MVGENATDPNADGKSRRNASPVIGGFNYQILCSIHAWLNLEVGASLALEVGEDFQIFDAKSATHTQVKRHAGTITLGRHDALEVISNYWKAQESDSQRLIEYVYLTTAEIGTEAGNPFGDQPGIANWKTAMTDDVACDRIRSFLIDRADSLPPTLVDVLEHGTNHSIRERLLKRLHWAPASLSTQDKRTQLLGRIADVIKRPAMDSLVEKTFAHLFEVVATMAARPRTAERILTKPQLHEELDKAQKHRFVVEFSDNTVKKVLDGHQGHDWLVRMNQAQTANFYCLIPFGEAHHVSIEDVLVAPRYSRRDYRGGIFNADQVGTNFFDDAMQLLSRDRLLAIVGPFGIGKSVLAKSVLDMLSNQLSGDTRRYYFRAYDLLDERHNWADLIGLHDDNANVVAVIDGLDELYLASKHEKNFHQLKCDLATYYQNPKHYVILTSRVVSEGGKDDLDYFFMELSDSLPQAVSSSVQTFLSLEPFSKYQIIEWLSKYWSVWVKRDPSATELKYAVLEGCHKGIGEAARTPLLLYMLASAHYQTEPLASVPNIYSVYKSFVETTIRGKWSAERAGGAEPLKTLGFRYGDFLEALASDIHLLRARLIASKRPITQQEDWRLDSNEEAWLLPKQEASQLVQQYEAQLHPSLSAAHLPDVYKIVMSNYFLVSIEGKWRFRDNNVLNFLVAQRLGNALSRLAYAQEADRIEILSELGQIPLERNVLHLMFYWLDSQSGDLRDAIWDAIYALVTEKLIVQLDETSLEQLGADKLYCDVLLALIFMRLNRRGMSDIQMQYFPKRLDWLTKAGRGLGFHFHDIVRVFFQKTHFIRTEFRRLNYKGYNFTNAEITESTFIQCRLLNAIFRGVKLSDARFRLCDLEATSLERVRGSVEFSDCVIDDLRVIADDDDAIDVKFVRCYIRLLHLGGGKIRGKIADSVIEKVILNAGHFDDFVISDSISSDIDAKHAKGVVTLQYGTRMKAPTVKYISSQLRVEANN